MKATVTEPLLITVSEFNDSLDRLIPPFILKLSFLLNERVLITCNIWIRVNFDEYLTTTVWLAVGCTIYAINNAYLYRYVLDFHLLASKYFTNREKLYIRTVMARRIKNRFWLNILRQSSFSLKENSNFIRSLYCWFVNLPFYLGTTK